jgi:hypothetical protein
MPTQPLALLDEVPAAHRTSVPFKTSKRTTTSTARDEFICCCLFLIDANLGDGSPFHREYGYCAHGVGPETAYAPEGWEERLVPVEVLARRTRKVRGESRSRLGLRARRSPPGSSAATSSSGARSCCRSKRSCSSWSARRVPASLAQCGGKSRDTVRDTKLSETQLT